MSEQIRILKPRKALNKAFLKVKPNRTEIESFKTHLSTLLNRTNDTESEEFHKNLISDFLKDTYYKPNHFINTKGRNDLVIHNGPNAKSTVGVIIETKKPTNRAEMVSTNNLNTKAFQELMLYYLRERITHSNLEVKHLIATNINEWFIFDATLFDRLFAQNKNLVRQFNDFEGGRLADTKTDFFYKQIAEPFIDSITCEIEFTHFNLQDYEKPLRNADKADDNALIALFKIFSPEHLLKLPFVNDSNSLDKDFYKELLHIIGLNETKEGSKKIIGRNKEGQRNTGSLLEDAIIQLDSLDKLTRLDKPSQFGNTKDERLFNVALELCITWINRILFLKLLEAQLIGYHRGDKSRTTSSGHAFSFLNPDRIKNFDDLNSLFFQVLARKHHERNEDVKAAFEKVPYLNSSLFEPSELEQVTLFISNLRDEKMLPIFSDTVLKDPQGKKRVGKITTLQYLFEFLDAYDFGAEGSEDIQEDNKTLINASVLGLIFEKINGYRDGSFFTPGFITMYMCHETIRKAVVQKFNEAASNTIKKETKGTTRRTIIPYNPALKQLARNLRNNSTKSEIILWKELKGKFEGKYDFHRQKPLDNYIADFFCYELQLVIEIDGETHKWEETQIKDHAKECRLNELGLNVLRFVDTEVFTQLDNVIETIRQYVEGFEKGDLSAFAYEDTPLNPLSRGDFITSSTPLSRGVGGVSLPPLSRGATPPTPLLRGATPPTPLLRGVGGVSGAGDVFFSSLNDIYEQIGDARMFTRQQANDIINSIKICDPAVGSGHFLVSALNEIIAIKNDLKILQDRDGKRLKEYHVEVVNDELIVTDEDGELFEYKPTNRESQRVQETLFHEKQTIIESCLFGVDINPNSVKICRLRLWIELLKNAYYIWEDGSSPEKGRWSQTGGVFNLPHLKTFRKELRNNLTPAEATLWTMLKGKALDGRKFRRQHSVSNYILDFYCPEEQLAVELDGQGHLEATQAEYDYERDLFLNTVGIRVLRFENKMVWDNPEGLLEEIKNYFGKQPPRPTDTSSYKPPRHSDTSSYKPPRPADTPPYKGGEYREFREFETLPNIDINIKCGNSLVSRFAIDADLKQALKKSKWTIDSYRMAVDTYRNAQNKEQKHEMERLIASIKSDFRSEISLNDPKAKKLRRLSGELYQMTNQQQLFEMGSKEKALWNKKIDQLTKDINKLETEIEEIKSNRIYENAFEWRFEFPEVLNHDGDFVGFDVVIGNPPYVVILKSTFGNSCLIFFNQNYITAEYNPNTYALFIELALSKLLKTKGQFSFIIPNSWLNGPYFTKLRAFVRSFHNKELINLKDNAFEVIVETVILISKNDQTEQKPILKEITNGNKFVKVNSDFEFGTNPFFELKLPNFVSRIIKSSEKIKDHCFVYRGVETRKNNDYISTTKHNDLWKEILLGKDVQRYSYNYSGSYVKFIPKELKSNANIDYYLRDKILMRRTGNTIIACADFKHFIALKNLYLIIPNDTELLALILLQLNSKLFDFIHKSLTTGENKAFAQFPAHYVETLPCRIDSTLIEKSKSLLLQREHNEDIESQIDQLVYELYDLTEEEIEIVEKGVG